MQLITYLLHLSQINLSYVEAVHKNQVFNIKGELNPENNMA